MFPIRLRRSAAFSSAALFSSIAITIALTAAAPAASAGASGRSVPPAQSAGGAVFASVSVPLETVSYKAGAGPWASQTVTVSAIAGSFRLQHGDLVTDPVTVGAPACAAPGDTSGLCAPGSVEAALEAIGIDATVSGGPDGSGLLPLQRYTVTFADPLAEPLQSVDDVLAPDGAAVDVDCVFCADTEAAPPANANGATIVYVHGGGFVGGQRTDTTWDVARQQFEAAGYRTYAINYRLLNPTAAMLDPSALGSLCDWSDPVTTSTCHAWLAAADDATIDLNDAVAFVRAQAPALGADPAKVATFGVSAGAIAALNNHYAPASEAGRPAATVSVTGIMDTPRQAGAAGPALLFAFGGVDPAYAGKFLVGIDAQQRDEDVLARAASVGNKAYLRTFPGEGHEITTDSPYFDDVMATTLAFLAEQLGTPGTTTVLGGTWLGHGTSFSGGRGQSAGHGPGGAAHAITGDFNGDGLGDVLWQGEVGDGDMVWFGGADGVLHDPKEWGADSTSFAPAVSTPPGLQAHTGDFDGDGTDDVLWYDPATGAGTRLWSGRHAAPGNAPFAISELGSFPAGLLLTSADIDGDGHDELVAAAPASNTTAIARFDGTAFTIVYVHAMAATPVVPVVGDLNGDGADDLYWQSEPTNALWLGHPAGSATTGEPFTRTAAPAVGAHHAATIGDFDGDGATDLVWYDAATGVDTQIWYGNRDGTIAVHIVGTFPTTFTWTATDVNGDHHDDLVVSWPAYHAAALFLGFARWQFAMTFVGTGLPADASPVSLDVNGDGDGDLLWR